MIKELQQSIWRQFGAGIDMLQNVIEHAPDDLLTGNRRFFYLTYHTVMFLDYYLTIPPYNFQSGLPFKITEPEDRPIDSVGDMIPERTYTRQELLGYVQSSRSKCRELIEDLSSDQNLNLRFTEGDQDGDMDYSIIEILLYNLRHTQHHVGQLHLLMRQEYNTHLDWRFRAEDNINE
jgi:hypothetical protein